MVKREWSKKNINPVFGCATGPGTATRDARQRGKQISDDPTANYAMSSSPILTSKILINSLIDKNQNSCFSTDT